MEKKAGGDLDYRGKNVIWKKNAWEGGNICKCALEVNEFYMKVWNFTFPHPPPISQNLDFSASVLEGPGSQVSESMTQASSLQRQ